MGCNHSSTRTGFIQTRQQNMGKISFLYTLIYSISLLIKMTQPTSKKYRIEDRQYRYMLLWVHRLIIRPWFSIKHALSLTNRTRIYVFMLVCCLVLCERIWFFYLLGCRFIIPLLCLVCKYSLYSVAYISLKFLVWIIVLECVCYFLVERWKYCCNTIGHCYYVSIL